MNITDETISSAVTEWVLDCEEKHYDSSRDRDILTLRKDFINGLKLCLKTLKEFSENESLRDILDSLDKENHTYLHTISEFDWENYKLDPSSDDLVTGGIRHVFFSVGWSYGAGWVRGAGATLSNIDDLNALIDSTSRVANDLDLTHPQEKNEVN